MIFSEQFCNPWHEVIFSNLLMHYYFLYVSINFP